MKLSTSFFAALFFSCSCSASSPSTCFRVELKGDRQWDRWPSCDNINVGGNDPNMPGVCFLGTTKAEVQALCTAEAACDGFSWKPLTADAGGKGDGCFKTNCKIDYPDADHGYSWVPQYVYLEKIADCTIISTVGDPILKRGDGTETRFVMEPGKFKRVLEQHPFNVSYSVGNPLVEHGGDWVLQVKVNINVAGAKPHTLVVKVVDPAALLPAVPVRAMPTPGMPLTTMHVEVDGKPLTAGQHTFPPVDLKVAAVGRKRSIGNGFVERVDIASSDFHMAILSAKAQKFANQDVQVKGLHLDVEFLKMDRAAVRGPIPEMLGLAPLSEITRKMLSSPA